MLLKYLNPSITCTASDSRCAFGIFAPRGIRFCLIFCSVGDLVPQFTRFTPTRSWICTNMLSLSQESSYLQSSMFALLHNVTELPWNLKVLCTMITPLQTCNHCMGWSRFAVLFPPSNWWVELWMFQVRVLLCPATVSSSTAVDVGEVVSQIY